VTPEEIIQYRLESLDHAIKTLADTGDILGYRQDENIRDAARRVVQERDQVRQENDALAANGEYQRQEIKELRQKLWDATHPNRKDFDVETHRMHPSPVRIWATLAEQRAVLPNKGDLVCVELPANCSIEGGVSEFRAMLMDAVKIAWRHLNEYPNDDEIFEDVERIWEIRDWLADDGNALLDAERQPSATLGNTPEQVKLACEMSSTFRREMVGKEGWTHLIVDPSEDME